MFRPTVLLLTAFLFAALLLSPTGVSAQVPMPDKTISLDVSGVDIHTLARMLQRRAGIEILVRDGDNPFLPVTIHLSGATLAKTLHAVALSAGALVMQNDDGIYVFTQKDTDLPSPLLPPAKVQMPPLNPADLTWRTIILQHAKSGYVLALMHWALNGKSGDQPHLPDGVAKIFALKLNNSLLVSATLDGYTRVKDIAKILDIEPVQVEVKVHFVALPASQKEAIDLSDPNRAVLELYRIGATFYPSHLQRTRDGTAAAVPLESRLQQSSDSKNRSGSVLMTGPLFLLTPSVEADNSITVGLNCEGYIRVSRTVLNGKLTIFDVTSSLNTFGSRVFLLVTPTFPAASVENTCAATP